MNTFAHWDTAKCLLDPEVPFDIAVVGVPFDTAVSYRTGARFGPRAIRAASQRQRPPAAFNHRAGINPYMSWAKVLDCDDIPVAPADNRLALKQMTQGYRELLAHPAAYTRNGTVPPRLVSLGGDHSIVLPSLRALSEHYGPISVIHFDAHLDTWSPERYTPAHIWDVPEDTGHFTHGSMFWMAANEGLLANDSCMHAGLRTRLSGTDWSDYEADSSQGWTRISCDDVDTLGTQGIVDKILERVPADRPVYISVDIDVLDPGLAPGTGTPEVGGWTSRELISMIRGLSSLNLVGADIVEVAPAYDHAETTALAAAQIAYELVTNMVLRGTPHEVYPPLAGAGANEKPDL